MAKISLQNIRKVYPGGVEVVPKLNLEICLLYTSDAADEL